MNDCFDEATISASNHDWIGTSGQIRFWLCLSKTCVERNSSDKDLTKRKGDFGDEYFEVWRRPIWRRLQI